MPLFEYLCNECGKTIETLILSSGDQAQCTACGSVNLNKLLSAPSSMSGSIKRNLPGPRDTGCCGTSPEHADCVGPGHCCGKSELSKH